MKINLKLLAILIVAFMVFTVIGTLSHEFGHIIAAKIFGYETELNYKSMMYNHKGYNEDENVERLFKIYEDNLMAINNNHEFVDKNRFDELTEILNEKYPTNEKHGFWITLGGPLQTILTCIIGLFILLYRKSKDKNEFKILDWLGVFLTLFILREIFNLLMAIFKFVTLTETIFRGDEFRMSYHLGFNQWLIPIVMGIIGVIISIYIVFKVLPSNYRISFITSGLVGGVLGYLVWFNWLGEIVLP